MAAGKRTVRYITGFAALLVLTGVLIFININSGSVGLSLREVADIIRTHDVSSVSGNIVWNIRLPRILAALLLGGALALSGFMLQTFFSNPIAGPFILGISSGAKLVVAAVMILLIGRGASVSSVHLILAAFIGSMMSMMLILAISPYAKSMSVLIVCGVMIGYICTAVTDFLVTFAKDADIVNLHNWALGSFSGMDWGGIRTIAVVVCVSLVLAFLMSKSMAAYQLGEVYASNMGVNIKLFRIELILLSSILSACVTAYAGPISFVGIAVPHLIRSTFGTSRPIIMVPACFLGGSVFCLLCDLIARTALAPTDITISSVTAALGAPVVIFMMLKRSRERW